MHLVLGQARPGAWTEPLTVDLLKTLLAFEDHEFFLCGPAGFMQSLYDGLRDLGVRDERIQAEAFGPSSLQRRPDSGVGVAPPPPLSCRAGHCGSCATRITAGRVTYAEPTA